MSASAPDSLAPAGSEAAPGVDVELAFVLAPRQNLFFFELVAALRAEAEAAGARTSLHLGNFPAPRPDRVYVLVPPHEYFTLMHGRRGPSPQTLKRTIFVCAEQPDTTFFEENVRLAPRGGAVFDINPFGAQSLRARGLEAEHLPLGWTEGWDRLRERERDIDVLFMGCDSERRSQALGRYAEAFSRRRTCLVLSDNSQPNWKASESFRADEEKWDLLGRAKILLNIHQGESPYFEWLRIVQAMSNGAVVVSEHSVDHAPLVPGRHFLSGDVDSLGLLSELLLSDPDRWWRIQTEAYRTMRHDLPLATGVGRLTAAAARLARTAPLPDPADPFFHQRPPDPQKLTIFRAHEQPASPSLGNLNAAALRRAIKDVKLDLLDMRRELTRMQLGSALGSPPAQLELVHRTRSHAGAAPRVSVLMALFNYEHHVQDALDSLLGSRERSWELIVVDDGSTDRSGAVVQAWLRRHEHTAGLLLRHPVNMGLGHARNHALGWARGELCFVLDADNEIYPHCLERLVSALARDPEAAFAYGIHQRFRGGRSVGLANPFPWEPWRLRIGNYIDAMALVRTSLLRGRFGGYCTDRRLHGWEDYDLWCRIAEAGLHGAFVPEIVARYRTTAHSMLSLTNISSTDAYSILIEQNPHLMQGVHPPL